MSDQFRGIKAVGNGKIRVTPDEASIVLGVSAEDKNVKQALAENSKKMNAVIGQLRSGGVDEKDIQTSRFTIQPQWKYPKTGKPSLTGYVVANNVVVKVRDLSKFGSLMDAAVNSGANNVANISFSYSKSDEANKEVLKKAVADAKAKAQLMVDVDGGTLGALVSLVEQQNRHDESVGMVFAASRQDSAPTPISAGEVEITATVEAVWATA